jgi:hypothetical protein
MCPNSPSFFCLFLHIVFHLVETCKETAILLELGKGGTELNQIIVAGGARFPDPLIYRLDRFGIAAFRIKVTFRTTRHKDKKQDCQKGEKLYGFHYIRSVIDKLPMMEKSCDDPMVGWIPSGP